MTHLIVGLRDIFGLFSKTIMRVGGAVLVLMTLLTFVNIIVRPISGSILGVTEIISFAFVIVVCAGFAYTALTRGNICVDILVSRFSRRTRFIADIVGDVIGIGVFAIIAWQSFLFGGKQAELAETAPVLGFPVYPFRYIIAVGSILLCLALLITLMDSLTKAVKK